MIGMVHVSGVLVTTWDASIRHPNRFRVHRRCQTVHRIRSIDDRRSTGCCRTHPKLFSKMINWRRSEDRLHPVERHQSRTIFRTISSNIWLRWCSSVVSPSSTRLEHNNVGRDKAISGHWLGVHPIVQATIPVVSVQIRVVIWQSTDDRISCRFRFAIGFGLYNDRLPIVVRNDIQRTVAVKTTRHRMGSYDQKCRATDATPEAQRWHCGYSFTFFTGRRVDVD